MTRPSWDFYAVAVWTGALILCVVIWIVAIVLMVRVL